MCISVAWSVASANSWERIFLSYYCRDKNEGGIIECQKELPEKVCLLQKIFKEISARGSIGEM